MSNEGFVFGVGVGGVGGGDGKFDGGGVDCSGECCDNVR